MIRPEVEKKKKKKRRKKEEKKEIGGSPTPPHCDGLIPFLFVS
jgi:hypothetical protein